MAHANSIEPGVAFLRNSAGQVAIAFDDPAYVRSDLILIDPETRAVHAVLHEAAHLLGHVSPEMANMLAGHEEVLLTARHPGGWPHDLTAPVVVSSHQ